MNDYNNNGNAASPTIPQNTTAVPQQSYMTNNAMPTLPQSDNGRWEAVDASTLGFTVSGDMNRPMQGPDGNIYCIGNSAPNYTGIAANQYNAIPTPASIVQMPPIVQPIALVPYASQNQPMLQYDANQRPPVPETRKGPNPKYRKKPYSGISVAQMIIMALCIVLILVFAVLVLPSANGDVDVTGIDSVLSTVKVFKNSFNPGSAQYFDYIEAEVFRNGFKAGFDANFTNALLTFLVPLFTALLVIIAYVGFMVYLVKLCKKQNPRGFNVCAFINLLLCVGLALVGIFLDGRVYGQATTFSYALIPTAVLSLLSIILNYFAKKNAYVLDEDSLKMTHIFREDQLENAYIEKGRQN